MKRVLAVVLAGTLAGCAVKRPEAPARQVAGEPDPRPVDAPAESPPAPRPAPSPAGEPGVLEVFPHVRADVKAGLVEFDGIVPIDCHDPATPIVYLEVIVCAPDTKEHESLVMTRARPSHVHAALLACGLNPGKPGSWTWDAAARTLRENAPAGDRVTVSITYRDAEGRVVEVSAADWIVNAKDGRRLQAGDSAATWVFAGSVMATRQGREVYDADGTGTLVGLATFGMETIAWPDVFSHEAAIDEPEWIADIARVPKYGTAVTVRLRAVR